MKMRMLYKKMIQENGFSIIEIMIAFSILVLSFVGISQSFPFGLSMNKSAEMATVASYLCQEKIEELTAASYGSIGTGEIEVKHRISTQPQDFFYQFQRRTEVNFVDGDLNSILSDSGIKKIATTVYFIDSISKKEKSYMITTLISEK